MKDESADRESQEPNTYQQFAVGEKVVTSHGELRTVLSQNGCRVFVEEEPNAWYHPAKLHRAETEAATEAATEATSEAATEAAEKPVDTE